MLINNILNAQLMEIKFTNDFKLLIIITLLKMLLRYVVKASILLIELLFQLFGVFFLFKSYRHIKT